MSHDGQRQPAASATPEVLSQLARLLSRSLRRLGEEGPNEEACLLAAQAWSLLRHVDAEEAERFNGLLHYLTSTKCQNRAAAKTAPQR